MAIGWKLHGDGRSLAPGEVVAPDERLSWGRTVGLGAQHVVAMFGATFVFPLIMGLNAQLAIMMSGIATICFLLIVKGAVPSYLGTSASFVGGVAAIRAQGGTSQQVTGAILVAGIVLAIVGVIIHFAGSRVIYRVLPPVVTGAVVMLIGFNLAPVVAEGLLAAGPVDRADRHDRCHRHERRPARLPRPHRHLPRPALRLRAVLAVRPWLRPDHLGAAGPEPARRIRQSLPSEGPFCVATPFPHWRVNWDGVKAADWIGFPPKTGSLGPDGKALVGLPPARLQVGVHPARAPRRHRAGGREHRPRQGRRRDDQDRPRPDDGPRDRRGRRRHGHRHLGRWQPDHHVRREHRRHGGHPRLLDGRVLRGRARGACCSASRRSSARWCRPRRAACSAGSPSCSTA